MSKDQASTLRAISGAGNVIALPRSRKRVIGVTGGKGGVGKSTVSLNLAVAYGTRGSKTLH